MNESILPQEIKQEIKETLKKCYACGKCTSGCPMAAEMDFPPREFLKMLALGKESDMLSSKTIWVCSSCQTCYSRCPFEINIPEIIDRLKAYVYKRKLSNKEKPTQVLHKVFLDNIKRFGRIHEAGFIGEWKLFSGKWFSDLFLGAKMFFKGKLAIFPEKIKKIEEVRKLFK